MFCRSIDCGKEVTVIFLYISKAFNKVWHVGLLYKLKMAGISGKLLSWFENYLYQRRQRVLINGQCSTWGTTSAGVPQGSVLWPMLFLLFINDIVQEVHNCHIRLFADDTCLFIEIDNRETDTVLLNSDLERINTWSKKWLVTFAASKTKSLIISNKKKHLDCPPAFLNNTKILEVSSHSYLGLAFSFDLKWNSHIDTITKKAETRINMMRPLKYKVDRKSLEIIYNTFILPVMMYGIEVWGGTYDSNILKLERLNIEAMRLITGGTARSNISKLYDETNYKSIMELRNQLYKILNNDAPEYLKALIPYKNEHYVTYNLRNNDNIKLPYSRLETYRRSFIPFGIRLWNLLDTSVKDTPNLHQFKTLIRKNPDTNVLYYYGKRWSGIHHARLRLGCSKLNFDLCYNLRVIDSPKCKCGY